MARVLIVDDALIMRNILGTMLQKAGHEIVGAATNADEAVELYRELKPDLVTMDILMEGTDGIACLEEIIRTDPEARVVMISAQGHGESEKKARAAGARGYVAKPIEVGNLLREAEQALAD